MLTSSVNVVQSSFPDQDQGEISGLSRSVSNLGSSLAPRWSARSWSRSSSPREPFAVALTIMLVVALIGLVLAVLIPRKPIGPRTGKSRRGTCRLATDTVMPL